MKGLFDQIINQSENEFTKKEQSHQEELTEQKATFQKMLDEVNKNWNTN